MYEFNGRTDHLIQSTAPARFHNSTSRSQSTVSIRTLSSNYAVIPKVTYFFQNQAIIKPKF